MALRIRGDTRHDSRAVQSQDHPFNTKTVFWVTAGIASLEWKQRIDLIARVLEDQLDPDFETAGGQILGALPLPLDPEAHCVPAHPPRSINVTW